MLDGYYIYNITSWVTLPPEFKCDKCGFSGPVLTFNGGNHGKSKKTHLLTRAIYF